MAKKALLSEKGSSLVGTSLLVSLIALVAIPSLKFLAHEVADTFCYAAEIVDHGEIINNTSQVYHEVSFNGEICEFQSSETAPSGAGEYDENELLPG